MRVPHDVLQLRRRHRETNSRTGVPEGLWVNDVHDQIEVLNDDGVVLRVPGRADQRFPALEGPRVRLSPTGSYALGIEATKTRHAAAILDTSTGELWPVPQNAYPSIAWSYGNLALVDIENALLACDAVRRLCTNPGSRAPVLDADQLKQATSTDVPARPSTTTSPHVPPSSRVAAPHEPERESKAAM